MKRSQLILIASLLGFIFGAGFLSGRFSAPRSPVQVVNWRGVVKTSESALLRLADELDLDEEHKNKLRPLFETMAEKLADLKPLSPERRQVFRDNIPRIRETLHTNQYEAFDTYVTMTERRLQRALRRRDGP